MKKNTSITALILMATGIGLIAVALMWPEYKQGHYLWGLAGGLIGGSGANLARLAYWSRPANAPRYEAKLEEQRINLKDERKTMIRERVGRQCFIYSFWAQWAIYIVISFFLGASKWVMILLWAFWFVQLYGSRLLQHRMEQQI